VLTALLVLAGALLGYAGGLGRPDEVLYAAALHLMPSWSGVSPVMHAPAWAGAAFAALPVFLLMAGLLRLSPRRGLMLAGTVVVAIPAVSFLALRFGGVWFAPGAALACLILAYPLWRWRHLESMVRHQGNELLRRDAEPRIAPREMGSAAGTGGAAGVSPIDLALLRAAERQRDEVLSFLSHDLRSPQSSILALLELHELDPGDNPVGEVHRRIGQYARRTLELSEQFLQLARAETREFDFEVVDLGPIGEEALEECWEAAGQKRITLEFLFDGEPVPVKADPALLRRVLINLLANAVKHSPEDTTITVSIASRGHWQVASVTDQGPGMPEQKLRLLLERPSTAGPPRAKDIGLTMAFVKTVVEKHGGRIEVESVPGHGTCFAISLPPVAG